jgi:hypothetical protein
MEARLGSEGRRGGGRVRWVGGSDLTDLIKTNK